MKFVEAVQAFLKQLGISLFGFPFWKYFDSPSYLQFAKADEDLLTLAKKYIDEKIQTLDVKLAQDGEIDLDNEGKFFKNGSFLLACQVKFYVRKTFVNRKV